MLIVTAIVELSLVLSPSRCILCRMEAERNITFFLVAPFLIDSGPSYSSPLIGKWPSLVMKSLLDFGHPFNQKKII